MNRMLRYTFYLFLLPASLFLKWQPLEGLMFSGWERVHRSKSSLYKHKNLNLNPHHPPKSWVMASYAYNSKRQRQQDPGAPWPVSLAEMMSSRFSEQPGLVGIRWKIIEPVTWHPPLISMNPQACALHIHVHIQIYHMCTHR